MCATILQSSELLAQSGWDWKDPNDFGFIDFGDNKVIGYNLLGIGAALLFDKDGVSDSTLIKELNVGAFREYRRDPLTDIWMLDYRVGRALRSYLTWGAGTRAYIMGGEGVNTQGLGAYLWFKWHLVKNDSFVLSYDNGVGPNYFFTAFPVGGTKFNFTTHYGLSFDFKISGRWLNMTLSNIHISNADIKGQERNPALDAIGITLGYSW